MQEALAGWLAEHPVELDRLKTTKEACRVPAGEPEGGQFVPCGDSSTGGGAVSKATILHKTADIVNAMADTFEKSHGWKEGMTREGFVKNWTKKLRGTQGTKEQVAKVVDAVERARSEHGLPAVPVIIRKPIKDEDSEDMGGQWNKRFGHIVINPEPKFRPETQVAKVVGQDKAGSVPEFYADHTVGVYAHEVGHSLETPEQASRAEDVLANAGQKATVKAGVSWYAAYNKQELVAESYAISKHPDFGKLHPDAAAIVKHVLGSS